ncbi:erythromycin esterase family protein [Nocardia caishijiensis]|uniref:Erythromycin esterase-like protein n=1 Tax=Nocardia caishijiensis TaxID=184756 RepID=A0ABQ6YGM0_9NOCA|nr:erythromycin esterase family protein [Nocardia caishijiensis]KAF0844942.1 erythromycin esterase-like protein [Nocardia caishijiensis]
MSQRIGDFLPSTCELLAFGEPTHKEPGFATIRNDVFGDLVERGFRSIALEIDRAAALAVDDYVRHGVGTLEEVMTTGFTHGFGAFDTNRQLVTWLRAHNAGLPPEDRVHIHGFDGAMETMYAPSPRRYLEYVCDYLELDLGVRESAGEDDRWNRTEAMMDPARSVGATADAERLRVIADDLSVRLHAAAPERIAATSLDEWRRAAVHLTTGIGLLRYHAQAATPLPDADRWSILSATRDALMAQNLLDIRGVESSRGPTLVCAHNLHLRRTSSIMRMGPITLTWSGAGAIVAALMGERYRVILGSLGRSTGLELGEPEPDTYEGAFQKSTPTWGFVAAEALGVAETRTDTRPEQGYFPLDPDTVAGADVIVHLAEGSATSLANWA